MEPERKSRVTSAPMKRWMASAGLFLILIASLWYGYLINPYITIQMCLDDPGRFDGQEVNLGLETRVVELLPDGFIIRQLGQTLAVRGDAQNASAGDYVQIKAAFHREGYLELKRLYVAKGRRWKIAVSILPALLVLFLFFRAYWFDPKSLLFKERA